MQVDLLVIGLVLVFGCAAFLFGILYAIFQLLAGIGKAVWSALFPERKRYAGRAMAAGRKRRICPRPRCRRVEYRDANFCSQCGQRLPR